MKAGLSRRALLASSVAASALAACGARDAGWAGDWVGESHERGHRLRDRAALPVSALQRRADLIIVGGGIAGLAAARAARRAGIDNLVLFELPPA
jgi:heterodisulfide reductase subunit A-like polyferredoxin